jgi:NhaP-type Na+/H+ or K+/H+ antiporter
MVTMSTLAVVVIAAAIFGWGALSARLERADLTAPIVFVAIGVLLGAAVPLEGEPRAQILRLLTEVTLVWVLFSDAARVAPADLRADARIFARLLGLGLPLTVVLGWLAAAAILPGVDIWLALLVGAALAPTDAALSGAVLGDLRVPVRIRNILNVESGLNDGIATPIVLVAIAGVGAEEGASHGRGAVLVELLLGIAAGIAVGGAGGRLLGVARRYGWVDEEFAGPAVLALALLAYATALAVGGNGFVAAFVGGVAFGALVGRRGPPGRSAVVYVEQTAALASLLVWMLVGAVAIPLVLRAASWQSAVYAVLSITVIRMVPVALVLAGSGLGRATALFLGWFGPRGLASVVFALLAVEDLGRPADPAVATVVTTVLLSVLAHGVTAAPLAARFGTRYPGAGTRAAATPSGTGDLPTEP